MNNNVYVLDAKRTPIGCIMGKLQDYTAIDLAAFCVKELFNGELNNIKKDVEMLLIGNVLSSGLGLNMAQCIAQKSDLSENVVPFTLNRACGSGMDTIIMAYNLIKYENKDVIIAGGTESMSNAPFINKHIRKPRKYGNLELLDTILVDGLVDQTSNKLMGEIADNYCIQNNISLEEQNNYTIKSYNRAINRESKNEIISIINKKKEVICTDEEPNNFNEEKLSKLKPIFNSDGTITAGNASKLADGASVLLLVSEKKMIQIKKLYNINPLCKIINTDIMSGNVNNFVEAPYKSISNILNKSNLTIEDIDLFEINEAFSCVPLICNKKLNIDFDKINIRGGAVSLGHPLGCSGSKIVATLLHNLKNLNKKFGCASICVGSGGASSIILENFIDIN